MSVNLYNSSNNNFCRKYLVLDNNVKIDPEDFLIAHNNELGVLAEQLLLYDRITFKVYGENIPLTFLIKNLGIKQTEELLSDGTISFMLWTNDIVHTIKHIPGVIPILPMRYNSPVHSDPEESINQGLNWLSNYKDNKSKFKSLIKKANNSYLLPAFEIATKSKDHIINLYKDNSLSVVGINNNESIDNIQNYDVKKKLNSIASEIYEISLLAEFNLSSNNLTHTNILKQSLDNIQKISNINENFTNLLNIEGIPDIKLIALSNPNIINEITKIRKSKSSSEFRKWIYEASDTGNKSILIKSYIDSIAKPVSFLKKNPIRFLKSITLFGIGAGIGAILGGNTGAAIGASVSAALNAGSGISLNLFDEFVLNKLAEGWNPKLFIEDIRKYSNINGA